MSLEGHIPFQARAAFPAAFQAIQHVPAQHQGEDDFTISFVGLWVHPPRDHPQPTPLTLAQRGCETASAAAMETSTHSSAHQTMTLTKGQAELL